MNPVRQNAYDALLHSNPNYPRNSATLVTRLPLKMSIETS